MREPLRRVVEEGDGHEGGREGGGEELARQRSTISSPSSPLSRVLPEKILSIHPYTIRERMKSSPSSAAHSLWSHEHLHSSSRIVSSSFLLSLCQQPSSTFPPFTSLKTSRTNTKRSYSPSLNPSPNNLNNSPTSLQASFPPPPPPAPPALCFFPFPSSSNLSRSSNSKGTASCSMRRAGGSPPGSKEEERMPDWWRSSRRARMARWEERGKGGVFIAVAGLG